MTASERGRTSWLWKPRTQSRSSAASGCTSAAARWVWRRIKWNSFLDFLYFPACYRPSVWTGAGAVRLQGAVGLLRLRADLWQVLREEGRNICKTRVNHKTAKIYATVSLFFPTLLCFLLKRLSGAHIWCVWVDSSLFDDGTFVILFNYGEITSLSLLYTPSCYHNLFDTLRFLFLNLSGSQEQKWKL